MVRFFLVEKLDLGDAAAAAPVVAGNDAIECLVVEDGEVEHHYEANWMRGLHLVFFSTVLTDSILHKVWNMVRCLLRGPFDV